IGMIPKNAPFASLCDLDEGGYIITDEECRTRTPGVFAAGDTRRKTLRQLITAASDGAIAANGAAGYINNI
ncbi:MAG: FAD-dependent oxidoreductase, partial [Oscillospiraceae bacterium]|nr:FAD-dependent oxidoreductase [Oscillospiraceae bacterium]